MTLPATLRSEVEQALSAHLAATVRVTNVQAVSGGCVSHTAHLTTDVAHEAFLKWAPPQEAVVGLFLEELRSLRVLADTKTVRVPHVIACHNERQHSHHWILLEWLTPGRLAAHGWELLAEQFVRLHEITEARFGWYSSNFIGSLPQSNEWQESWPELWRHQRLEPQWQRACTAGFFGSNERARMALLLRALDELLAAGDEERAVLLHGDLWNGNVLALEDGTAALIDPASYYGHREVDFAMAELFGGFDPRFYASYEASLPFLPGYRERRRVYQMYYLLVHVNLFGASYVGSVTSAMRQLGF